MRGPGLVVGAVVGLGLTLTACGGSSPSDTAQSLIARASSAASVAESAASANAGESSAPAVGGDLDCSGITKDVTAKFIVFTQVLAGAGSKDAVDGLRSGQLTSYTPDGMDEVLAKLEVLRGHPATGFGDPGASIDYFTQVNKLMRAMIEADSVSQAQIDAYTAATGSPAQVIGKQLPINAALSQYCKF